MKKLLAIVASALTLGAFADAGNTPMTFELPEGIAAGTEVTLVCNGEAVHTTTATSDSITYSTEGLAAGEYWLELAGEPITESVMIGSTASAPQFASAKYAGEGDPIIVESGTLSNPTTIALADINNTQSVTIKAGCAAKVTSGSGNKVWNVSGEGPNSYLVLDGDCGYGFNANTTFDNLTIVINASADNKEVWFETRDPDPYGSNVNIIIKHGCAVFSNNGNINIGSLSIEGGSVRNNTNYPATVTVNGTLTMHEGETKPSCVLLADGASTERFVPRTLYIKGNISTFADAEGNAATPIARDTVVFNANTGVGKWGGGANITTLKDYVVQVDREQDIGGGQGVPANQKLVINWKNEDNSKGVYLSGNIGAGAQVSGTGVFYFCHQNNTTCTIGAGATISCLSGFQDANRTATIDGAVSVGQLVGVGGTFKLNNGATLTVNEKLADMYTVTTDVANKVVKFDSSTKTYSVVDPVAQVGDVKYATLAEAKAACAEGGALKIIADMTGLNSIGANTEIFGSPDSIEIAEGVTASGYFPSNATTCTLIINGTFNVVDGYTNQPATVPVLKGSGTIHEDITTSATPTVNVTNADEWTGSFTETNEGKLTINFPAPTPTMPEAIEGGSTDQQTAYVAWAADKNITDLTTKGIVEAFALNLTAEELTDKTFEQAVQDKINTLLETIDADENIDLLAIMQAVIAGTSNGTITIDGYDNATIKLVTTSLGEGVTTDAKLFRLKVEFNAKGQN